MFKFVNQALYRNIVVIGCGGTGSRLVPLLTQFMRTMVQAYNPAAPMGSVKIFLVDGDIVEQKNLVRQNFIEQDVGKPKALVLAERYGRAFGMDLFPVVQNVTLRSNWSGDLEFETSRKNSNGSYSLSLNGSLILMCVDSAEARKTILSRIRMDQDVDRTPSPGPAFVIDAGNEDNFGQVRFFSMKSLTYSDPSHGRYPTFKDWLEKRSGSRTPKPFTYQHEMNFIPIPVSHYEGLGESASEKSCAELNQTLAINAIMATTMMGIVQNLYFFQPMTYDCIRVGLDGANATEFNTPFSWLSRSITVAGLDFKPNLSDPVITLYEVYKANLSKAAKDAGMEYVPATGEVVGKNAPPPLMPVTQKAVEAISGVAAPRSIKIKISPSVRPVEPLPEPVAAMPTPAFPVAPIEPVVEATSPVEEAPHEDPSLDDETEEGDETLAWYDDPVSTSAPIAAPVAIPPLTRLR